MVGSYAQPLLILLVGLDLNSPSLSYLFLQKWVKRDAPYCFLLNYSWILILPARAQLEFSFTMECVLCFVISFYNVDT